MRVLWTHNFDPVIKNSGSFMHLLVQGLRDLGVDLELLYIGNLRSVKGVLNARSMIKKIAEGYDLVHAQFGSACALATLNNSHTKKILSLRGTDWYWYKEKANFDMLHGFFASSMSRIAIKSYDLIITMSHRMTKELNIYSPLSKTLTLPDPVDLKLFRPSDRSVARAKLGFPDDKNMWVLFTTMSTKNGIKRVSLATDAVDLAKKRMPGISLRIASGVPHNEMPLLVSACDVILTTSTHEGWPNCIKEALACNIPFIATDVSDLSMISAKEPSCRICPPDPEILAKNICDVLSTKKECDLRKHVAHMDIPLVSKRLFDVYRKMINQN